MQADLFGTKKKQAGYKKRGITHSDIYLPPTPEGNHPSGRRRITDNRKDMLFVPLQ